MITLAALVIHLSWKFKDLVIVTKLNGPDLGRIFLAPYLWTLYLETLHLNSLTPRVILSQTEGMRSRVMLGRDGSE